MGWAPVMRLRDDSVPHGPCRIVTCVPGCQLYCPDHDLLVGIEARIDQRLAVTDLRDLDGRIATGTVGLTT